MLPNREVGVSYHEFRDDANESSVNMLTVDFKDNNKSDVVVATSSSLSRSKVPESCSAPWCFFLEVISLSVCHLLLPALAGLETLSRTPKGTLKKPWP